MQRYLALQKIVELGSFSKAAVACCCTQSAISQMVSSLEDELSLRLLNRSRSGISLTDEGKRLYPAIEKLVYAYFSMREKANEIKGLEIGTVRIGTISSISSHWLPRILKEFKRQYPNIEFILKQGDYDSILEWIKTGVVDFGFIAPQIAQGIKSIFMKEGRMLAVLPENHPLAKLDVIPLESLGQEPFILLEEGANVYEPLFVFKSIGLKPTVRYTMHDDYSIMSMVEAGLGVSILAELVLMRSSAYKIVTRPTSPPIVRRLAIGYKDKQSLPIAARRFIEMLREAVDDLP
jgi:DNA-binding transcriptional LysR family regulator